MKKILLLLLTFVSIHVYSQRFGTAEFDFLNAETLNGSGGFTVPTSPGEFMILNNTFTKGPVSISFSTAGNGAALRCDSTYKIGHVDETIEFDKNKDTLSCSLVIRGHGEMIIKIHGNGYSLSSVEFGGSIGDLSNINSTSRKWTASSGTETEVRFMNGTQHTSITSIKVTYIRPPEEVQLWSSTPKNGGKVTSFSEMNLEFNLPVTIVNPKGFTLYELDDFDDQISESEKPLTAYVSDENENVLILRSEEEIREDGKYEVVIDAGAIKNVDNSLNAKMNIVFTVEIERNTLKYSSISLDPDAGSIPQIPETIILTYEQKVKVVSNNGCVLQKEGTETYIQLYLEPVGQEVHIHPTDGEISTPGRWILRIPEESISNGNNVTSKTYRYNPEIKLVYTIENELSILRKDAEELLTLGGGNHVLVGYPSEGSNGRTLLMNVLSDVNQASVDDYKEAIEAYYNETDVLLPQSEKWYKIAAVDNGNALYLVHKNGEITLTPDIQQASSFKTKTVGGDTKSFAFMVYGDDDNYLHIGEMGPNSHNLSVQPDIPQFTLSKLSVEGKKLVGLLKMEDGEGQSAAVQFPYSLSKGFTFVESSEEDNMPLPSAKLSSGSINKPGDPLTLTISGVGKVELADNTKPYFKKGDEVVSYGGDILKATNDSTLFQVNTNGLSAGKYTLYVPAGTFAYKNKVKDVDVILGFEIKGNNTEGPNFNYSYSKYNCYQYLQKNVNNMISEDMNDITLFAYVPDDYTDMIPNPAKKIEIMKYRTLSIVGTGHFEIDSTFSERTQIEGVKAIRLKLDKDFVLGDLKNEPGLYLCYIPEATFGDANFGEYLKDPTSVRPEDCIVNSASSSIQFNIDDGNALNSPTPETFELAKKLSETHGVGYPSQYSEARKDLDAKIEYVQGGEARYQQIINNFYKEKDVEMPSDGVYYRVTAVSDNENSIAYLTYDGNEVGLTDDVKKATGFKAIVNEDGSYLLQTGDGWYFKQISEAGNVSVTPTAANNITFEKLSIDGVEAKTTFGTLSIKAEKQYMNVDIANLTFLAPSEKPDHIDVKQTNAFKLEEIDKTQIYVPEVSISFNKNYGDYVESLKSLIVTFVGATKVDLADKSKIKLNSPTAQNVGKIEVIPTDRGNEFTLSFSNLPESPSYTLDIRDGAFTFTFADVTYPIEGDAILINIGPTGISGITITESDESVYDLQGRKVSGNLKSGIYIKNGKKVYIK